MQGFVLSADPGRQASETPGAPSARQVLASLAFASFCAAVPLIGNNLPAYTPYIWIALPFLAVLHTLAVRAPFPRVSAADLAAMLLGLLALGSLAYTANRRATEISLPWLGLCLSAYLLARCLAAPGSLPLVRRILIWIVCATVLDQMLALVTLGNEGYPLIFSSFFNKNVYGGILASLVPLIFLDDPPSSAGKTVLKAAYGTIVLAGLVLTFSKGAWLIAGAALAAIAALCLIRRDRRTVAAVAIAVLLGLAAGLGLDRLSNQKAIATLARPTPENVSLNVARSVTPRLEYWRNALAIARTAPLIGKGYGTFAETHIGVARWPLYARAAHSFPLQMLAELGIAGLALFVFPIVASGVSRIRRLSEPDGEQPDRIAFYLAALVLLLHGFLDVTLNVPEGALWFWLLLGIGSPRREMAGRRTDGKQYPIAMGTGLIGLVLLVSAGVFYLRQERIGRLEKAAAASKDPEAGVQFLSQALQIRKNDDKLLAGRAAVYWRLGRLESAWNDLRAAARANPYKPAYRLNLASIALMAGRKDEARRLAGQALAINPSIPETMEGYGAVLAQTGDRLGGAKAIALSIIRRGAEACSLPPDYVRQLLTPFLDLPGPPGGEIRLALAAVEFRLGHYEQSYRILPEYARLTAEDAPLMNRLVGALREKGFGEVPRN